MLSRLDENGRYVAYTTTTQTSPITGDSAVHPSPDEGGTFTAVDLEEGLYEYELAVDVDVDDDTATHTVGAWAWRDFEEKRYVGNQVLHFRPDGAAVTERRQIVETTACNGCHNPLKVHGGLRREVDLCITCHTADVVDPDTGRSVDMAVMIHKIHAGESLPSVEAGEPYQIIGYQQSVHDYSTVVFPQPVQQCETCHTGPDADVWKEAPTRNSCSSCHDRTSFEDEAPAGFEDHAGGPQPDDSDCTVCHKANGLEGIEEAHFTLFTDPSTPDLVLTIVSTSNTGPGETPEIVFDVTEDGVRRDILTAPLTRLTVTVAGPTTDYATYWQHAIQGGTPTGDLVADGQSFRYTFPAPIPAGATGSYAIGFEGYLQADSSAPRYPIENPIVFVPVTDPVAVPRREIVAQGQCESCHADLSAHGGSRNNTAYCAMCHNPNNSGDERWSRFEGSVELVPTVDLRSMIHGIHMGEDHAAPYVLGGFPAPNDANPEGTPIDFTEVRFPGDPRACGTCHVGGSFDLPLAAGLLPTHTVEYTCTEDPDLDADELCDSRSITADFPRGPAASACIGCHNAPDTIAHAATNTDVVTGAEACATCHGPGKTADVAVVHALDP